ncbi:MAG: Hcp family type VI secretion system effector [Solirubrobacteraceae bacterium]
MGIGRPWKAVLLVTIGAAGGAAALAVASVPDPSGVIHACVATTASNGRPTTTTGANLRIIDPSAGQSCTNAAGAAPAEASIAWNTAGPPGAPGAAGAPGRSVTIAGGNTFTISGGQVITVGKAPGVTINPPAFGGKAVATLTLSGNISLTTNVLSFSLATSHGAGKVKFNEFQITRTTDKASPKLALACATGTHIKKAVLTVRKGKAFVTYTLTDSVISSLQSGTHGRGDQPVESLSFNYAKINIEYTPH